MRMKPTGMKRVAAVTGAVAAGLMLLTVTAPLSHAEGEPEKVRRCVNGPGLDTRVLDEKTVLARDNGRSAVLIEVDGCRLTPHDTLVFEYRGTSQICNPVDVNLSVRSGPNFRTPCFIQSVTPISNAEAQVLMKQKYKRTDRE